MQIAERASPNFGSRRGGAVPDMVVLHYTGMATAAEALHRLCDPDAAVSAHYLIDRDGTVIRLVAEAMRAWHAGASGWGGVRDINSRSIGIELVNPGAGPGGHPFPEPQMAALEALLDAVVARWRIVPERVLGHACVAPGRKADPGPRFDWRRLALTGRAVWLDPPGGDAAVHGAPVAAGEFRGTARRFGYPLTVEGGWDSEARAVWRAFADRFRPWDRAALPGAGALAQLRGLARRWPCAA